MINSVKCKVRKIDVIRGAMMSDLASAKIIIKEHNRFSCKVFSFFHFVIWPTAAILLIAKYVHLVVISLSQS